jgi:Flp pilus assembly protein TadG
MRPKNLFQHAKAGLARLIGDRRGNVAIATALCLPGLLGAVGLGTEVASWYGQQRNLQNAADAAAIAAGTNAGQFYAEEARAVAAQYGYVNGQDGITVAVANNQTCPDGKTTCYRVTLTRTTKLLLAGLVGYTGDTSLGGVRAKRISAVAMSIQGLAPREYCLVALSDSGTALRTNGAPMADLSGCNVMSNSDATCNGHNLQADFGDAVGTNNGCGVTKGSGVTPLADPYAALASQVPDPSCSDYPQLPDKNKEEPLPPANQLSGFFNWSGNTAKCGDVQLTGDVTIDTPADGATLVIKNGRLDLNGHTLRTTNGSGLTIIFTGGSGYDHTPMGGGELDFQAPTQGQWSGVAIYQDPSLTEGVEISEAGNSPTWNITGLVYLPKSSVTFSGAVNKSSNGKSCFVMVADTVLVNGTGSILANGQCKEAGLIMPTTDVPSRGKLVL